VLRDEGRGITLVDSRAICEYLEETNDKNPMINGTATNRAEIRRLVALFDENFFADVTHPLLEERMKKRLVYRQSPDRAPCARRCAWRTITSITSIT
jgi:glutathione S-transferase